MLLDLQRADVASKEEYFHIAHAREIIAHSFEVRGSTALALKSYADVSTTLHEWMVAEPINARADRMLNDVSERIAARRKATPRAVVTGITF